MSRRSPLARTPCHWSRYRNYKSTIAPRNCAATLTSASRGGRCRACHAGAAGLLGAATRQAAVARIAVALRCVGGGAPVAGRARWRCQPRGPGVPSPPGIATAAAAGRRGRSLPTCGGGAAWDGCGPLPAGCGGGAAGGGVACCRCPSAAALLLLEPGARAVSALAHQGLPFNKNRSVCLLVNSAFRPLTSRRRTRAETTATAVRGVAAAADGPLKVWLPCGWVGTRPQQCGAASSSGCHSR